MMGIGAALDILTGRNLTAAATTDLPPVEPAPRPQQYPDAITREIALQKAAMWISREAETIPGVRKALHVIVGTIGTLKLSAWKGKVKLPVEAYPWLQQPDRDRTSQTLLGTTVRDLIWHDRCVWRDLGANQYQRIRPDRVAPVPLDVDDLDGVPAAWIVAGVRTPADRLVVFDGAGLGGLRKFGAPLLDMYLRIMEAAARNADDPVPLGVLKNTGSEELPEEDIDRLLDRWEEARRLRATGYAGRFLEYQTPGYSPRDLQLVEITEAITKDVARLFGLPGYYLGVDDGSSTTYANVVDRRRDLLEALNPWSSVMTQTLSMSTVRYYLGPNGVTSTWVGRFTPYGTDVRFDTSDFERDTFQSRVATLAQAIGATGTTRDGEAAPLLYVDEARDLEPLVANP
jgi:hypothetical protein